MCVLYVLQITANLLLLVFVHCLGLWLYDKTEHAHRKVFSECRGCVAARIEAEEESDKLVGSPEGRFTLSIDLTVENHIPTTTVKLIACVVNLPFYGGMIVVYIQSF